MSGVNGSGCRSGSGNVGAVEIGGEDSCYSDLEKEEEDDDDTVGALLSSVSLLDNHRPDEEEGEDEDTVGALLSCTSLNVHPLGGEEGEEEVAEEEEEEEAHIHLQRNVISVSSLHLCESTSSFVSIHNKDDDSYASALLTDHDGQDSGEDPSTDATTSRRQVRFDDDEQYHPSHHPGNPTSLSPPPSQAPASDVNAINFTSMDDSMSRQLQDIRARRGRLLEQREKMVERQSSGGGVSVVGSTGSGGSQGSYGTCGDSCTSTTSNASTSSGDNQTLKTLIATTKKNRRVFNHLTISEDDEYCGGDIVSSSTRKSLTIVPSTEKTTTTELAKGGSMLSRHVEHGRDPFKRRGTLGSTSSASSIIALLEHAPLEVHLSELQKRRSKLLEMVEAQGQNNNDTEKQRSIEFSLFLIKDKLNQLHDLGVLATMTKMRI